MLRRVTMGGALALPLLLGHCGGIAIVDPPDVTGGAATTASSGGSGGATGGGGQAPTPIDVCGRCDGQSPVALESLPPELGEISGLAASRKHPGMYWAHNDSGDAPRLFLLREDGTLDGIYDLVGAEAVDWEDMTVAPCDTMDGPDSCLYVGDFGDNDEKRDDYVIYRTLEPDETAPAFTLAVQAFPFSYPDGSHDAEALFWADGQLHILTKQLTTVSQLFRLPPLGSSDQLVAEELLSAFLPPEGILAVTGADANEQGILVRTYTSLFFYPTIGLDVATALSEDEPCSLPAAMESQGETIAWRVDDLGYATASEGAGERLNRVTCP